MVMGDLLEQYGDTVSDTLCPWKHLPDQDLTPPRKKCYDGCDRRDFDCGFWEYYRTNIRSRSVTDMEGHPLSTKRHSDEL